MKDFSGITSNPEVQGGEPCIAGTRITTWAIGRMFESGQSVEHIQATHYPSATLEQINEAIWYEGARMAYWRSKHFVAATTGGERCVVCDRPATHKIGEEIAPNDPSRARHNFTAYVCCARFLALFGDATFCEEREYLCEE